MKSKRVLSLLLIPALCAGILSALCPVASADTLSERQQALVAVAMAYYDKGHSVQYDGTTIVDSSPRAAGGRTRSTNREPPEYATPHETFYSVCSDFIDQVYWETFRYSLFASAGSCWTGAFVNLPESDPTVIYHFERSSGKDPEEAIHELYALAQPGDVFTTYSTAGHSMLFLGDVFGNGKDYLLHSFGSGINAETGRDAREYKSKTGADVDPRYGANGWTDGSGGGIRLTPNAESHLVSSYAKGTQVRFCLTRPLNVIDENVYPVTFASRFRVLHPRLSINRIVAEKTRFNSTLPGETLTLSVALKNSSSVGYAFPVTEPVPAGVELLDVSEGGACENGVVRWNVQLDAGQSRTLSYTCRVTAARGAQILFAGGLVGSSAADGIPSNTIPVTVGGGKLTAEDREKLASVADGAYADILASATAATLGETVYRSILGRRVRIPDAAKVLSRMTKAKTFSNHKVARVFAEESEIAPEDLQDFRMLVPMFHSGLHVWNEWGHERCVDPRDMHAEPGDLIVRTPDALAAEPVQDVMVYLGNGKYLEYLDGAPAIVEEPEFVKCLLQSGYYVLRPTLAYDELPRVAAGDLNDDGFANAKDVTVLRRHLAGGYGVTLDEAVADVNRDGSVNAKDVTTLRRFIAGGYDVKL